MRRDGYMHQPPARSGHRAESRARALARRPSFVWGVLVIFVWCVTAVAWRWTGVDPYSDTGVVLAAPGFSHWFGTDRIGRDVFARVLAGAEPVLAVAPAATAIAVSVGTAIGLCAGYYRGWIDTVSLRALDVVFVAPAILVLLVAITAFGRSAPVVIVTVGLVLAPMIARVVRAQVLVESRKEYVVSAQLQGERTLRLLTAEILPNVWPQVLVQATLCLGVAVFVSTSLSFLGLAAAPPSPDWGLMVSENRAFIQGAWWTVVFPCLAIMSLVVATTLVAEDLNEVIVR